MFSFEWRKICFLSFLAHYNCEHCGQTFVGGQAKRNFTRHLKKHNKQPKVYPTCKLCNKVFKYQSEVRKHEKACFYKQMQQKGNNVQPRNIENVKKVPADLATSEGTAS